MAIEDERVQGVSIEGSKDKDGFMDEGIGKMTESDQSISIDKVGNQEGQTKDEIVNKPNIATFRGIPKKLHEAIKQTAADLGVSPGELARYLLEIGLTRIEEGEGVIEPKFVPGGYTLYPEEGPKQPRRKGRRKSKVQQRPRSYYGVPREVVKAVLERSKDIGVTQGEMARYLFEQGLERYQKGELIIEPEPIQQIATLYPEDLGSV